MKTFINKKDKYILLFSLVLIAICSYVGTLLLANFSAKADAEEINFEYELPNTSLEHISLSSPLDVYCDDNLTAIVQNKKLLVYNNGQFLQTDALDFTTLNQVKRLNQTTLLVIDNAIVYSFDITTKSKKELTDTSAKTISGKEFDLNSEYLVTAFGTDGHVYKISNDSFSRQSQSFTVTYDKPIALNDKNEVFFVNNNKICKKLLGSAEKEVEICTANPSKMIANDSFVFFIQNSDIYKVDIATNEKTKLEFSDIDDKYKLGCMIDSPIGISFKGENLLITDESSIQEFSISSKTLTFTGYAISKDRSAYNRVGVDAFEVEKFGNVIGVLDKYKFMIYQQNSSDIYARENYKNYFAEDFDSKMPTSFALGKNKVLLTFDGNTSLSSMRVLDLESGKVSDESIKISDDNIIKDTCYQSGYFYALISSGASYSIYKFDESTMQSEKLTLNLNAPTCMSVDVRGNVYIATDSNVMAYYKSANNTYTQKTLVSASGTKKMINDLTGKLFVLNGNGINYIEGNSLVSTYSQSLTEKQITSFSFDFIDSDVYCIYQGEEILSKVTGLENISISSITKPDSFITTGKNADLSTLKIYSKKQGANAYLVESLNNGGFKFNSLIQKADDYVYICDIPLTNDYTICALATNKGIALIDKKDLSIVNVALSSAPQTAYTTTGVNMYFLPVLTLDSDFSLTDGNTIRLNKSVLINPEKQFTSLGREFYFASATVNGVNYKGYVPVSFTADVLTEIFTFDEYKLEKVNKTTLYSDSELTEKLFDIPDGQRIKVFNMENGLCQVSVIDYNGTNYIGYISANAIKNPAKDWALSIVIIFAVVICAFSTAIFFITKRKLK